MSILDQLLGGSDNESASRDSSTSDFDFGTSPVFGLGVSDVLRSSSEDSDDGESNDFVGIGDLGLGLAAPTFIGASSSNDSASAQSSDGDSGGLLGGLL